MAIFLNRQRLAAQRVEQRLDTLLPPLDAAGTPARLAAAMRHAVLGGGKRFRPFLVLECAALLDAPDEAALDVAAALECVHCYSLAHDDLPVMDNDALRRGQPTVWKAFDEWTALLAGDALLTLAFDVLSTVPDVSAAAKLELVRHLAQASGHLGMVGGQMLDLEANKRNEPAQPSLDHVFRLQNLKTGALIGFACEAGLILADAGDRERGAIRTYSRALGLAFQISDDLLDATGDVVTVGKAIGKDGVQGKATIVSVMGIERARIELAAVVGEAVAALRPFDAKADALREAARFMLQRDR